MSRSALTGLNTSKSEREYVTLGVELGIRGDGRGRFDYRAVAVQAGVLAQTNGSARVTIAHNGTDVLVAVKVDVGEPEIAFPSRGRVEVCAECSNSLFPKFDERASGDINAMLGGALERSMRGAEGIDLDALCILPGKFCWVVHVDVLVLQADGNLLDASSFGTYVALNTATIPKVTPVMGEGGVFDDFVMSPYVGEAVPIVGADRVPVCISMSRIGSHFIVDASMEEESCVEASVGVFVDRDGRICGSHKQGSGAVPIQHLGGMSQRAIMMAQGVFIVLDQAVKEGMA
ncbi:unnamed protein product, partial [Discosporangium mesarthrocarpum]